MGDSGDAGATVRCGCYNFFMRDFLMGIFSAYLRLAAKIQLGKIRSEHVIGVTGSAGKTSCKEAVVAVLKDKFHVKTGKAGFNSELGLPMDILDLNFDYSSGIELFFKSLVLVPLKLIFDWKRYEVLVFEMGVDSPKAPGNMKTLLGIVHPDIGVLLNVLPVHTAYFQKTGKESEAELVEKIAEEKGKLIESLPANGCAILNADDKNVIDLRLKIQDSGAKVITFGNGNETQVKGFIFESSKYVFSEDYKYTFAAAVAVGKALGISEIEAKASLAKNLVLPPGRMSLFFGIKGTTIIDSSYNASRVPMVGALKTLQSFPGKRKIAVLGDMRELGDLAKQEHEEVAREAVRLADYVFTFGPLMEEFFVPEAKRRIEIHDSRLKKEIRTKEVRAFRQMTELIDFVKNFVREGDVLLVKGSQNTIFLERLVEAILVDPSDTLRLCRRGKMWERKRSGLS